MIDHFEAENCGCLKNVACGLTGIHAFIGPNDSGKSTLLKAIAEVVNASAQKKSYVEAPQGPSRRLLIRAGEVGYALLENDSELIVGGTHYPSAGIESVRGILLDIAQRGLPTHEGNDLFHAVEGGAWIVRFDGDALRQQSELITPASVRDFFASRGRGLPGIYDLILGKGDDSFRQIQERFYALFPSVKRLGLLPVSTAHKTLQIQLRDGTLVPSSGFSEGMLYYLAYAALAYLERPSLIAIEEPENGLHPARISEIMRLLRELSKSGTQILIATHSPLVVNELQPHEVSVVTRSPEDGTKVTALVNTTNFAERSKVYALGELWLSYANGTDESGLLDGDATEAVSKP